MINSIIENIKQEFINLHKSRNLLEDNLLSLFVVGSFCGKNYKSKRINDLDIRAIYEKITPEMLAQMKMFCEMLANKYTTNNIYVSYSLKAGIVKPILPTKSTEYSLLIHFVPFSRLDYLKIPKLHAFTFSKHNEHLLGPLKPQEIRNIPSITLDDVLNEMEGINQSIEMIKEGKLFFLEYEIVDDKCILTPKVSRVSNEELLEIIYHSVSWACRNILYAKGYSEIEDQNIPYSLLTNILKNKELVEFPCMLEKIYEQYREGKLSLEKVELNEIKKNSLAFLSQLREKLYNLSR